jgi:hypothetical protein
VRQFGNGVLGRTLRLKRDEVIGGWRKLHHAEFHNIVTDLIKALPGNSSVNTFQRATIEAMSQ